MKHVNVHTLKEVMEAEKDNASVDFINVCTPAEYQEKHIGGIRNVPLDELENHVKEFSDKATVYVHCQTGNRGRRAVDKLMQLGVQADLVNVEGGISAWDEAGFQTTSLTNRIPIMRQVLIAAGGLVLLGYLLSIVIAPQFIYLSVFVGAGLFFAGISGWCGMSFILAKMPWNR